MHNAPLPITPQTTEEWKEFDRANLYQYRLAQYMVGFVNASAGNLLHVPHERVFYALYSAESFGESRDLGNFDATSAGMEAGRRLLQRYGLSRLPNGDLAEGAHQWKEPGLNGGSMGFMDITSFQMVQALLAAEISHVKRQVDAHH